jgi:DNA polymerase III delta prime subunit
MELDFGRLHHAYLLLGSREAAEAVLQAFFEENGISLKGSPDYFVFKDETLGIDEARKLSEQAIRRAFVKKKIFFLAPDKITLEAQNALLKTFEEPIEDTHFFLVLREENQALPTLRSRVQIIRLDENQKSGEAKKFLALPLKDRLTYVKKFVDAEKSLSAFLDELLFELRQTGSQLSALEKVYKVRLVSDDRAASPRLILEHLSTVL